MARPRGLGKYALSDKQERFLENWLNPNSPHFANATEAYLASGYTIKGGNRAAAAACASRLLCNSKIVNEIIKRKNDYLRDQRAHIEITGARADMELLEALEACKRAGDRTNQIACVRLLQQRTGQLSDKVIHEIAAAPALKAALTSELSEIAKLRCLPGISEEEPIDAQAEVIDSRPEADFTDELNQ